VDHKLSEVSELIAADIEAEVRRGKRDFDNIATEIQNKVQRSIPEIKDKIRQAGAQLRDASMEVRRVLGEVDVRSHTEEPIRLLRDHTAEYGHFRHAGFLAVCLALLAGLVAWCLALLYGCCGRRSDASQCLKYTGASWMLTGVFMFFTLGPVVLLVTSALFTLGSLSSVAVCSPLLHPPSSELVQALHPHLPLPLAYPHQEAPTLVDIVSRCHQNESLYSVLSLHLLDDSLASLLRYRDRLHLDEKVAALEQRISVDTSGVRILTREAKARLRALANSSLARRNDWGAYGRLLHQKVLTINLLEMAAQLNQTADQLPAGFESVSFDLKNDALYLESLQRWAGQIQGLTATLADTAERLQASLHAANHTSLRQAIRSLVSQAEYAQRYLRTNGSREVVTLVQRFTTDFLADVDSYVAHVEGAVRGGLGRCGPLSHAANATRAALCSDVLTPFNGFWAATGWVLVVFAPCVALALALAGLYRKTEPWPGPLNDSHYDKKGRNTRDPAVGGGQSARAYRSASPVGHAYPSTNSQSPLVYGAPPVVPPPTHAPYVASHAYPSKAPPLDAGPPRYTSQPSLSPEYERPPPYYYPGNA